MRKGKPSRTELFDAICALAFDHSRAQALVGDALAGARTFFERSLISDDFPTVYFEFPLAGTPGLDLLAIYRRIRPGSAFAPGAGYGYQPTFDWFATVDPALDASVGLELDLSQGVTERAGIYLQQRTAEELLQPFLDTVGEGGRAGAYRAVADRMPRGWSADYVGLFPARPGSPMRLGGYLTIPSRRRCAQDPAFLASRLEQIGFESFDAAMLGRCCALMALVPAVDVQFDLTEAGTLADTFGLSLNFGRCGPKEASACFSSGYGAQVMGLLSSWGLADDRWRLIPDATFARRVDYERADGDVGHLLVCMRLNYAKVKFSDGVPRNAKFYLTAQAQDISG